MWNSFPHMGHEAKRLPFWPLDDAECDDGKAEDEEEVSDDMIDNLNCS